MQSPGQILQVQRVLSEIPIRHPSIEPAGTAPHVAHPVHKSQLHMNVPVSLQFPPDKAQETSHAARPSQSSPEPDDRLTV